MEGHIAATYALVYRFLKQQSQNKAAEAVKKAARPVVALRDDIEPEGPPLEDIVKDWRTNKDTKPNAKSPPKDESSDDSSSGEDDSGSEFGSSSEDTSGSESDESSDDSVRKTNGKELPPKDAKDDSSDSDDSSDDSDEDPKGRKSPRKGERDTSMTLSSAGENVKEVAKQAVELTGKKSTKGKEPVTSSKSGALESSDAETSSSEEGETSEDDKAPKPTKAKCCSSSESSSDSEDESEPRHNNAHVAKKRKTSESGTAVTTAVSTRSQESANASQKKEKPPKVNQRFQRVKVQNMAPEQLIDNGYEARGGATNDYGERAHRDLVVTRGAGFRKEKNKKKRGSYRGGEITMESHSIKFEF